MLRLNQQNKPDRIIKSPNYKISKIKTGIVHLGIGAFHRAHQAFYTDQVLEKAIQLHDLRQTVQGLLSSLSDVSLDMIMDV